MVASTSAPTSRSGSRRHVVLVGAMGAGKSTIGRLLALRFRRRFKDNDATLTVRAGETAAERVVRAGADDLHRAEADVLLDQLDASPPAVIAAAASVVEDARVNQALEDNATVVWLRGNPALLAVRARSGGHRPWRDDPARLRALATARAPRYASVADLDVDVTRATPTAIVDEIVERLDRHGVRPERSRPKP